MSQQATSKIGRKEDDLSTKILCRCKQLCNFLQTVNIQAYKHTSIQAYKHTIIQAYKQLLAIPHSKRCLPFIHFGTAEKLYAVKISIFKTSSKIFF